MKKANIPGLFIPWRDILHDGPVPEGLSLEKLSEVRTKFITDQGWGKPEDIKRSFIKRDSMLKSFEQYEKVILWFEHDLYDQLQILQILDWFHSNSKNVAMLSIICTDSYLGRLSPEKMKRLVKYESPITKSHLLLSSKAWCAFRSSSPEKWAELLKTDTSALPFLEGAVVRMLEEYPNCSNGLSRTGQQALKIISDGEKKPGRVFGRNQESEDRFFLGDSGFWSILYEFLESSPPLLELSEGKKLTLPTSPNQELAITSAGREVLSGKRNWIEFVNLDRWIGGVHLTPDNIWYWDSSSGSLAKTAH